MLNPHISVLPTCTQMGVSSTQLHFCHDPWGSQCPHIDWLTLGVLMLPTWSGFLCSVLFLEQPLTRLKLARLSPLPPECGDGRHSSTNICGFSRLMDGDNPLSSKQIVCKCYVNTPSNNPCRKAHKETEFSGRGDCSVVNTWGLAPFYKPGGCRSHL